MGYEVEIKAHAYRELKEVIDQFLRTEGRPVTKDDIYYAMPGDVTPRFRIRTEDDDLLITAKQNHREGGVECNRELEFSHRPKEDRAVMDEMARMLGYETFIHKHKEGWQWYLEDVHIELLNVTHLGWYLEMEIISDKPDLKDNQEKVMKLYMILESVGLCSCDVEQRSYQLMLREWSAAHPGEEL